ncbi:MAG: hypothetical protein ACHQRJ_09315 [Alphaproteobacteria bacterium]
MTVSDSRPDKPRRNRKKAARAQTSLGQLSHVIDEAVAAGLLAGEKSEHITARTTPALVAAAKRRTGISSTTTLIEVALASLALPDPVAQYMRLHRGELGKDHELDH